MGFFRRAKAKSKPGKHGLLYSSSASKKAKGKAARDCDSIGDELAVEDQFDLYVPLKRPSSILKNGSFDLVNKRKCLVLQGNKKQIQEAMQQSDLMDHTSTVSSLTTPSIPSTLKPALSSKMSSDADTTDGINGGNGRNRNGYCSPTQIASSLPCCGISRKPEDTDDANSIVAGRHPIKTRTYKKKAPPSLWSALCGPQVGNGYEDQTTSIVLRKPKALRKETSLFDTLQEEEPPEEASETDRSETLTAAVTEAETTIAIVELDSKYGDTQSVVTTNSKWKLKFPKVRSLSKNKTRSIPKIRSMKLGKKKKRPQYVKPTDLD